MAKSKVRPLISKASKKRRLKRRLRGRELELEAGQLNMFWRERLQSLQPINEQTLSRHETLYNKAVGMVADNRPDEARDLLVETLVEAPLHAPANYLFGKLEYEASCYFSAALHLRLCLGERPHNEEALLALGLTHIRTENFARAAQVLDLFLQLNPNDDRIARLRSYVKQLQG